ncbi:MAG: hypothetical protein ACR2MZ_08685 [Candidatus Dormibacter sp.]|uniref:hypothetical protein n=1 Tax=Candidatus Dormibacter sp. TaxID=2973982 RepID=UPI003D9B0A17
MAAGFAGADPAVRRLRVTVPPAAATGVRRRAVRGVAVLAGAVRRVRPAAAVEAPSADWRLGAATVRRGVPRLGVEPADPAVAAPALLVASAASVLACSAVAMAAALSWSI